jgi:hypothetical protein
MVKVEVVRVNPEGIVVIERLPSRHQVVRVRPTTFAYTRPLTPADVSGMTGRLVAAPVVTRKASPFQEALGKMKGFFKA